MMNIKCQSDFFGINQSIFTSKNTVILLISTRINLLFYLYKNTTPWLEKKMNRAKARSDAALNVVNDKTYEGFEKYRMAVAFLDKNNSSQIKTKTIRFPIGHVLAENEIVDLVVETFDPLLIIRISVSLDTKTPTEILNFEYPDFNPQRSNP